MRWGVSDLFQGAHPHGHAGSPGALADAEAAAAAAAGSPRPIYTDAALKQLLERASSLAASSFDAGDGAGGLGPGLELVAIRDWGDLKHEEAAADEAEEEEEEKDEGEGEEGEGEEGLMRSDSVVGMAHFWDSVLKDTWRTLQREEAARARAARHEEGDFEASPAAGAGQKDGGEL